MPRVIGHEKLSNVFWIEFENRTRKLATKSVSPGCRAYADECTVEIDSIVYRIWDPYRSKLAAAILKGIKEVPLGDGNRVLYLGAASGTTASYVSDIVGTDGQVFCVEISTRPLHALLSLCLKRANMIPILADARSPEGYAPLVREVDVIYQDVAQPDQVDILIRNMGMFLRDGGHAILALKARSVDVTKEPREIFRDEIERLGKELDILDVKTLDPYEKDHAMFVLRK